MKSLGDTLKLAREERGLILRKVSIAIDIDQSLICKFEKNERKPTKEQLIKFADFYNLSKKELTISWYADKIVEELMYTEETSEILKEAEAKINYYKAQENGK